MKCRNALGDGYTEITSGGSRVGVALFVFAKPDTLVRCGRVDHRHRIVSEAP